MNKTLAALISAGFLTLSATAFAAEGDFDAVDVNSDGQLTMEELTQADNGWTETAFQQADADGNGTISKQEYEAAM